MGWHKKAMQPRAVYLETRKSFMRWCLILLRFYQFKMAAAHLPGARRQREGGLLLCCLVNNKQAWMTTWLFVNNVGGMLGIWEYQAGNVVALLYLHYSTGGQTVGRHTFLGRGWIFGCHKKTSSVNLIYYPKKEVISKTIFKKQKENEYTNQQNFMHLKQ